MKIYLQLLFLIISLNLFSCKEKINKSRVETTETQTEIEKQDTDSTNIITKQKKVVIPNHYEHFFVSSRSGLNYRDSPKGKVLGKFHLNTQLKVIEYPKISDIIIDGEKTLKGEWLGVENKKDTVYVFNAFLSSNYNYSDIKVYQVSPYYKERNGRSRTAFLNLSESYFTESYYDNENTNSKILPESNLKDTIRLNSTQRNKFLKKINVNESDNVFVYVIKTGSIHSYKVKDLTAIACLNIYFDSYNQTSKNEYDFEFGLDLGNSYNDGWENFTYIGDNNPFQKGKFKPIIWKEVDTNLVHFNFKELKDSYQSVLSEIKFKTSYMYKQDNMDYYLLNNNKLVVIDPKERTIVFNHIYYEGEGSTLTMPKMEKDTVNETSQWTGKLFKNKPSVIYGFQYFSFGCESIGFLTETEPSIPILCDNRH